MAFPRRACLCPGEWPVVHISTRRAAATRGSNAFDHVAFRTESVENTSAGPSAKDIHFEEFRLPRNNQRQLFFRDPDGIAIELDFGGDETRAQPLVARPIARSGMPAVRPAPASVCASRGRAERRLLQRSRPHP